MFYNYHKHTCYSNIRSLDCVSKPEEYIVREIQLNGDKAIHFSTEHGYQGDIHHLFTLCNDVCIYKTKEENKFIKKKCKDCPMNQTCSKPNVKLIEGVEAYYVDNRFEKERGYHLVLIGKNADGNRDINRIMSEANSTGFYYKPRIDKELLLSVNPSNVIVTTACIAGKLQLDKREESIEWIKEMKNYFGDNFFLEVQTHNETNQKELNSFILEQSKELGVGIIHGCDSHYVHPEDEKYRNLFLSGKGISYEGEGSFILDFPDEETIINRYEQQGVLSGEEIKQALGNTLIFSQCEPIFIDKEIKLPSISDNPNGELWNIVNRELEEIPKGERDKYKKAAEFEMDIIEKTHMEDYFILDYHMVKRAIELGGKVTQTGRGSAVSFLTNKFFGFTNIDRLKSPVTLYPTRFMSTTRILQTKSLPDIDINVCDQKPFIQATEELLGEENCSWLISFKPLQAGSAFRFYCKCIGLKIAEYDEVAKNLDNYREDKKWKDIIEESKHFVGVIESISSSPCSMLVWDKNVANEIGLIRTKDGICCNLTGISTDYYKYLKNDILKVTVWSMIKEVCELVGMEIPTIDELNELIDGKTYKIYENGLTCTVNQVDSDFATKLAMDYKPRSVAEMSAFVAGIRPGFASLLDNFIQRRPYTTGVQELDDLLEDSYHYLMYQESIMKYLVWLGVPEDETYGIIKKIAKKKFKEEELKELKVNLLKGWVNRIGSDEGFESTWQVVEDASRYSFNASHSLSYAYDSLYCAYLKSHYPLEYYTVAFNEKANDTERTIKLTNELSYFNIELKQPKFRYSRAKYFFDKETNNIYKGTASIKHMNENVSEYLYSLKDNTYNTFTDLLIHLDKHINTKQMTILIMTDFFSEFGKSQKLLNTYMVFNNLNGKKQINKNKYPELNKVFEQHTIKETASMYKFNPDDKSMLYHLESLESNIDAPMEERIKYWLEYVGSCSVVDRERKNEYYVIGVNTKYTPVATCYSLSTGNIGTFKIYKRIWRNNELAEGDIFRLLDFSRQPKKKKVDGGWVTLDEKENILEEYFVI